MSSDTPDTAKVAVETADSSASGGAAAEGGTLKRTADQVTADGDVKSDEPQSKRSKAAATDTGAGGGTEKKNIFASAVSKTGVSGKGFGGFGSKSSGGFSFGQKASMGEESSLFGKKSTSGGFGSGFGGWASAKTDESSSGDSHKTSADKSEDGKNSTPTSPGSTQKKNLFAAAVGSSGVSSSFGSGFGGSKSKGSGVFGAASSVFGNKLSTVFGSSGKLEDSNDDANGAVSMKPSVFDKDAKPPSSGEEDETHLCQLSNCKLYLFSSEENSEGTSKWDYRERGRGKLTLNESSSDGKSKTRLVLRQDTTKKLCLNARVWKGMAPSEAGQKGIRFSAVNAATGDSNIAIYLVKTSKADECKELLSLINKAVDKAEELGVNAVPETSDQSADDKAPIEDVVSTNTPGTSSKDTPDATCTTKKEGENGEVA